MPASSVTRKVIGMGQAVRILVLALALAAAGCTSPRDGTDAKPTGDAWRGDGGADGLSGARKPLALKTITPARSPLQGGVDLDLAGQGFSSATQVWIGTSQAPVQYLAGSTHLFVTAPPASQPGQVDVRVQNGSGAPSVLAKGLTYIGKVTIDGFEPQWGPQAGGTEITLRGSGFLAGDRVLVGYAEALSTQVLDSTTLVAVVPPMAGAASPEAADLAKAVVAVRHGSGLTQAAMPFTYGRVPKIDFVTPSTVGRDGGSVTLHGSALGNMTSLYAHGALSDLAPGTAGSVRGATLPALHALDPNAQPGPADLLWTSPFGNGKLSPAFAYADPADPLALYGAVPATGSTAGGASVRLLLSLPAGVVLESVQFGGKSVQFSENDGQFLVDSPAHPAGSVDISVTAGGATSKLANAFRYFDPVTLAKLTPDNGPSGGGSAAQLTGKGLNANCSVRIGTYGAQVKSASADGKALSIVTPPGAAGTADVTVTCGGAVGYLPQGFTFTDKLHINAVVAGSGATGGGSLVTIYGSGFKKGLQVAFDGKSASAISVTDGGHASVKTPPHVAGPVAVSVAYGKDSDTLIDGYSYYSPSNSQGGTWGSTLGGTLNVSVLNIYNQAPIEAAYVHLGQPGDALYQKYGGLTDKTGQIVFSGPDIIGDISVSASKIGFSASSIVSFDAGNATLLLFPYVPPSQGNGGGGPGTPKLAATLRGTVLDIDKYLQVPPTNCLKSGDLGDKTCDACATDKDCAGASVTGATFACVDNGAAGKRCLGHCKSANDCGKGFGCFSDIGQPGAMFCKPSIGIRKVFCATSVRDIDTPNPDPSSPPPAGQLSSALPYPTSEVDELTGKFEISSRLDELAIQCVGGYVETATNQFVPTVLGVRRHVFPIEAQVLEGQDVRLDIPLTRTLAVRLDHPQKYFPSNFGGTLRVGAWLNLGSDGYVVLADYLSQGGMTGVTGVTDDVALLHQPIDLPKDLTDVTYTYFARAEFGGTDTVPVTATLHEDVVDPGNTNLRIRKADAAATDSALGIDQMLNAVLAGPDGQVLIVAQNGRLYRGTPQDPKLLYLPPILDPYAQPAQVLAAAGTPTDATMVGENGLIRRLFGSTVNQEQGVLAVTLHAVCQGPMGRVAVGNGGGIEANRSGVWEKVSGASLGGPTLRAVACTPTGAVAVGNGGLIVDIDLTGNAPKSSNTLQSTADLYAIAADSSGTLWIGGDAPAGDGPVLLQRSGSAGWQSGWPAGTVTPAFQPLRQILALQDGALLLIDREGGVHRMDAAGITNESPERLDLRPRAGALLPDGSTVLVGQPGLWLGPFLTIPAINKPGMGLNPMPMWVEWSVAPGPQPSCTLVHLDGNNFPFWWLYVAPDTTSLQLPDFASLKGIQVFPVSTQISYVATVNRIYIPGLSINGFATMDLEFGARRSWATNATQFQN